MTSPVFDSIVLRVVNKAEGYGFLRRDVRVQTARSGGFLFWVDINQTTNNGADPISANDNVMLNGVAIRECYEAGGRINVDALQLPSQSCILQILFCVNHLQVGTCNRKATSQGLSTNLVVNNQCDRCSFACLPNSTFHQHGMHILSVKHIINLCIKTIYVSHVLFYLTCTIQAGICSRVPIFPHSLPNQKRSSPRLSPSLG